MSKINSLNIPETKIDELANSVALDEVAHLVFEFSI